MSKESTLPSIQSDPMPTTARAANLTANLAVGNIVEQKTDILPEGDGVVDAMPKLYRYEGVVDYEKNIEITNKLQEIIDKQILKDSDFVLITDSKGKQSIGIIKSGVYKIRNLMKMSTVILSKRYFRTKWSGIGIEVTSLAVLPDGASAIAMGWGTEYERTGQKEDKSMHNQGATAETRSKIRAMMELFPIDVRYSGDLGEGEQIVATGVRGVLRGGKYVPPSTSSSQPQPEPESKPKPQSEPQPESKPEAKPDPQPEPTKPKQWCGCTPSDVTVGPENICGTCSGKIQKAKLRAIPKS